MSINSPANQHTPDERQAKCWEYYLETIAKGVKNAKQSALKAGYSKSQADHISIQQWFVEKSRELWRKDVFHKSEKVLEDIVNMETNLPVIGMFGPLIDKETKKPIKREDHNLLKIKASTAEYFTKTIGKKAGYAQRTELTDGDGKPIQGNTIVFENYKNETTDQ